VPEEIITHSSEETTHWAGNSQNASNLPSLSFSPVISAREKPLSPRASSPASAPPPRRRHHPTFTLVHVYGKAAKVYHADLYRIENFHDFETLGMEDMFASPAVVILEWSERFPSPPLAADPPAPRAPRRRVPPHHRPLTGVRKPLFQPLSPYSLVTHPSGFLARLISAANLEIALPGNWMANELASPSAGEAARIDLKSYNVTIPMGSLSIGVDNIHHDVFLSPSSSRPRAIIFSIFSARVPAPRSFRMELRNTRTPDHSGFRNFFPSCSKAL